MDKTTIEAICQQIDTQPLEDAIHAFLEVWGKALAKACKSVEDIKQAFLDVIPWFADVLDALHYITDEVFKSVAKRDRERAKWRRPNAPKIRPLLLDKRSKVHRCRNAC